MAGSPKRRSRLLRNLFAAPLALAVSAACEQDAAEVAAAPETKTTAPLTASADLDGEGTTETIVVKPDSDPFLSVRHAGRLVWQGMPKRWKPWKMRLADVDGDGKLEIILGVHKTTRFFPRPHNCPFVFGWDGETVFPKWLGSALSRPFTDFEFLPRPGKGALLVSIEIMRDAKRRLVAYEWDQFGFAGDWQSNAFGELKFRQSDAGAPHVVAEGSCLSIVVRGRQCELVPCPRHKAKKLVTPST